LRRARELPPAEPCRGARAHHRVLPRAPRIATDALAILLESLDLTALDDDRFEGRSIEIDRPRLFGGELLAQTLIAAARTVEERTCHSLHVNFVFPGNPSVPIEYRVRRVRDGRRFAQRQVSAWQRGREIALGTVSFTSPMDDARDHQHARMPVVPDAASLRSELDQRHDVADRLPGEDRRWLLTTRAIEMRPVRPVPLIDPPPVPPEADTWLRAIGRLPDDRNLHCAVLAYASDMTLLDVACYPHGVSWIDSRVEQASLDHAMWFHRPFRCDEWLLYQQAVPVQAGGRALARASVFTSAGVMVASVAQEGLSRLRED
jgi:acyl-CoA thioesterase II